MTGFTVQRAVLSVAVWCVQVQYGAKVGFSRQDGIGMMLGLGFIRCSGLLIEESATATADRQFGRLDDVSKYLLGHSLYHLVDIGVDLAGIFTAAAAAAACITTTATPTHLPWRWWTIPLWIYLGMGSRKTG